MLLSYVLTESFTNNCNIQFKNVAPHHNLTLQQLVATVAPFGCLVPLYLSSITNISSNIYLVFLRYISSIFSQYLKYFISPSIFLTKTSGSPDSREPTRSRSTLTYPHRYPTSTMRYLPIYPDKNLNISESTLDITYSTLDIPYSRANICDLHTCLHLCHLISQATRPARWNFLVADRVMLGILWATVSFNYMWG